MNPHPSIEKACALLRKTWPTCKGWTDEQLLNWIGFFNRHQQCAIVMDGDECVGFGAVRFLRNEADAVNVFQNDASGHIAWVEMVVSTVTSALPTLMVALTDCVRRVGCRVTLLGGQDIKTKKVRLYPIERYARLVEVRAMKKD
jgi:hypothetical protein